MNKTILIFLLVLVSSLALNTQKVFALDVSSVTNVAQSAMAVPVSDSQLEGDIHTLRMKEVGTKNPADILKKFSNGVKDVLSKISSSLPSIHLPNIPIPKIGGLDLGSFVSNFSSFFGGAKSDAWDSMAVTLARLTTDKVFDDMTAWVNGGFNGNPAFAVNLQDYMRKLGNSVLGEALNEVTNGFACQPFRLEIKAAIERDFGYGNTGRYFQSSCTLTDIAGNVQNFLNGDFNSGGWQNWFQITQVQQNNPYGEYLLAVNTISLNIQGRQNIELANLNWSNGFISTRKCVLYAQKATTVTDPVTHQITGVSSVDDKNNCLQWEDVTPGHLIADQVSKVVGTAVDQLNLANRFDEFFGAVVNQLANKIFNPSGLISSSGVQPITGSVDYGQALSGSANAGDCTVDKSESVVGDTVNWSVSYSGDNTNNPIFTWTGDGIASSTQTTNPTLPVVYTLPGDKTMDVSVTYSQPDYSGTFDPATQSYPTTQVTQNLQCAQTVHITQYSEPVATCTTNFKHASAKSDLVVFTVTVSGGSGSYQNVSLNGAQGRPWDIVWKDPNGGYHSGGYAAILPGATFDQNGTFLSGQFADIINGQPIYPFSQAKGVTTFKFGIVYDHPQNPVNTSAAVMDSDKTLNVLSNISCDPVDVTN